jgi:hypothetical protein
MENSFRHSLGFRARARGNSLWATAYGNDALDQIGEGFIVSPALRDPAADGGIAPASAETRAGAAVRQRRARLGSHETAS